MKNALQYLEEDIESVNLGNLHTVEFDLVLPSKGEHGSVITWESKDTRFLKRDGKVIQPRNGTGKRMVTLVGQFEYETLRRFKEYNVTILEENDQFEVVYVYPIHIEVQVGEDVNLINTAIIKTNRGETLTHTIDWRNKQYRFDTIGDYEVEGVLLRSEYIVHAHVHVMEEVKIVYDERNKVCTSLYTNVKLSNSRFYEIQMEMVDVLLHTDDDQMLYNFRVACGRNTKGASAMHGWDTLDSKLRGHTTGHYLSALAKCYGVSENERIKAKIEYMVHELKLCQDTFARMDGFHKGYVGAFDEQAYDALERFAQYPTVWAPYYTMHKLMAGLLDIYREVQVEDALIMLSSLGEWVYQRLHACSVMQRKQMWGIYIAGEYGGMNEALAQIYHYTKDIHHLQAALMFHNDRLFWPMENNIDALCYLHVNQHVPQILGALQIFKVTKEKKYYDIAKNFWNIVVKHHTYVNGGVGEGEIFHASDTISSLIDDNTAETCASYNMLKLTKELYEYETDVQYMDYYERVVFNHILATRVEGVDDGSIYFFPMEPGSKKHYQDENSCCHGIGLENHFHYRDAIFFKAKDAVYINLFMSASLTTNDLQIDMVVNMQIPDQIHLYVKSITPQPIKIRVPYWSNAQRCIINNEEKAVVIMDGYLYIQSVGEQAVNLDFSCGYSLQPCVDEPMIVALQYGPYVLCALNEQRTYLYTNLKEKQLHNQIIKDGLMFYDLADLLKFIPLYMLHDQRYHTYIRCKA